MSKQVGKLAEDGKVRHRHWPLSPLATLSLRRIRLAHDTISHLPAVFHDLARSTPSALRESRAHS